LGTTVGGVAYTGAQSCPIYPVDDHVLVVGYITDAPKEGFGNASSMGNVMYVFVKFCLKMERITKGEGRIF